MKKRKREKGMKDRLEEKDGYGKLRTTKRKYKRRKERKKCEVKKDIKETEKRKR